MCRFIVLQWDIVLTRGYWPRLNDGALFAVLLATVLLPVFANFRFRKGAAVPKLDPSYASGAPSGRSSK